MINIKSYRTKEAENLHTFVISQVNFSLEFLPREGIEFRIYAKSDHLSLVEIMRPRFGTPCIEPRPHYTFLPTTRFLRAFGD